MERDQLSRLVFGTPVIAALVSTTPEVMTIPLPARPQEAGFILVTFTDIGTGDVALSAIGLSLGAETKSYANITLACGTYVTPSILLPFNPSKHGLFTGPTVTLTFTATGTLGTTLPGCTAQVIEYPLSGPMPPVAALGVYTGVAS